uniref:osteocrin n=1 Tax=Gasterosteus aculeatus aculeatus TaxID=481459 RepID=UPI001A99E3D7|nr:osteocrin [Gasterosteus aculeatus aculeatus]
MPSCGCLLFPFMMFFMLLHCDGQGSPRQRRVVRPASWAPVSLRSPPRGALKAKLFRLEDPRVTEKEVMQPKRRRSFSGTNAPLDRISAGAMETQQGGAKQRKAAEPRRRVSPPPVDRIGISRLPSRRG